MKIINVSKSILLIVVVCFLSVSVYSNALANDRVRGRSHGREVVEVRHQRYNYQNSGFSRSMWFGFEFLMGTPRVGAIVRVLPFGSSRVVVGGIPYSYHNHVYYRPCASGYVVVPKPVVVSNVVYVSQDNFYAQSSDREKVTINLPNSNGSYTSVTLIKSNNGYFGPQGEYYPSHPTVDQLRVLYSN